MPATWRVRLREFVARHELADSVVVTSLPGDLVTYRTFFLPFRDRKKLEQTIPFELESQVPFGLEDIVIDYDVLRRDRDGCHILAALVQRSDLTAHLALFEEAGLDPKIVDLAPLATLNALRLGSDVPPTFLFVGGNPAAASPWRWCETGASLACARSFRPWREPVGATAPPRSPRRPTVPRAGARSSRGRLLPRCAGRCSPSGKASSTRRRRASSRGDGTQLDDIARELERRRLLQRAHARHRRRRAPGRDLRRRAHRGVRRLEGGDRRLHPRDGVEDLRHPRRDHHRGRPGHRQGQEHADLLGDGHLPAHPRHRQRPLPDLPVHADRQRRQAGHRPPSPARPEQRPGRLRRRADPDGLPGLSTRRPTTTMRRQVRGGLGRRTLDRPRRA